MRDKYSYCNNVFKIVAHVMTIQGAAVIPKAAPCENVDERSVLRIQALLDPDQLVRVISPGHGLVQDHVLHG